jgi:hypothetical protein
VGVMCWQEQAGLCWKAHRQDGAEERREERSELQLEVVREAGGMGRAQAKHALLPA